MGNFRNITLFEVRKRKVLKSKKAKNGLKITLN